METTTPDTPPTPDTTPAPLFLWIGVPFYDGDHGHNWYCRGIIDDNRAFLAGYGESTATEEQMQWAMDQARQATCDFNIGWCADVVHCCMIFANEAPPQRGFDPESDTESGMEFTVNKNNSSGIQIEGPTYQQEWS